MMHHQLPQWNDLTLINLTPYTLEHVGGKYTLPSTNKIAKVADNTMPIIGYHQKVPLIGRGHDMETYLYNRATRMSEDFPEPKPGTILVVSSKVRLTNPTRYDLWNPSGYDRDSHGLITGFRYFEGWGEPNWDSYLEEET